MNILQEHFAAGEYRNISQIHRLILILRTQQNEKQNAPKNAVKFLWLPRLRSRPEWPLIRPCRDKSDLWSDRPRLNFPLTRLSCGRSSCALKLRSKIYSDQNSVRPNTPLIRQKCARSHLWSDSSALEITSDQTEVRSKLPMFRLKCAQNRFWVH